MNNVNPNEHGATDVHGWIPDGVLVLGSIVGDFRNVGVRFAHLRMGGSMRYRRAKIMGGTYFFTVNLAERHRTLLVDHIDLLRAVIHDVKTRHPFHIEAMVILPDHLHALWTLPEGDDDYPTRWALIKAGFSRHLPRGERRNPSRLAKGERGIWQRRYWEHLIRDETDHARHVDYIHYNPVKHGYVRYVKDWPHSSFHHYVRLGLLPADWAGAPAPDLSAGELESWGSLHSPQPTASVLNH